MKARSSAIGERLRSRSAALIKPAAVAAALGLSPCLAYSICNYVSPGCVLCGQASGVRANLMGPNHCPTCFGYCFAFRGRLEESDSMLPLSGVRVAQHDGVLYVGPHPRPSSGHSQFVVTDEQILRVARSDAAVAHFLATIARVPEASKFVDLKHGSSSIRPGRPTFATVAAYLRGDDPAAVDGTFQPLSGADRYFELRWSGHREGRDRITVRFESSEVDLSTMEVAPSDEVSAPLWVSFAFESGQVRVTGWSTRAPR